MKRIAWPLVLIIAVTGITGPACRKVDSNDFYFASTPVATPGDSFVDLEWAYVAYAQDYRIWRSTVQGGPYVEVARVAAPTRTYRDMGVTNGTTYYYVIEAIASKVLRADSAEVSATPTAPGGGSGGLVAGFGTGGVEVCDPSFGADVAYWILIYEGFLYILGQSGDVLGTDEAWLLEKRFDNTGALSPGFNPTGPVPGTVTINPSAGADPVGGFATDGQALYIVGRDDTGGADTDWRIEKRNQDDGGLFDGSDGAHSPEFGTGGVIVVDLGVADAATAVVVDGPGNALYVGGHSDGAWQIHKRALTDGGLFDGSDGAHSPNFADAGVAFVGPAGGFDSLRHMVRDATALYALGQVNDGGADTRLHVEKLLMSDGLSFDGGDGAHSPEFGTTGQLETNLSGGNDIPGGLMIVGSELFITAWTDSAGAAQDWYLEKRDTTDGGLYDGVAHAPAFDTDGILVLDPSGGGQDGLFGPPVVDSGTPFMFLMGWDGTPGGGDTNWRIEKRSRVDGTLDPTFNGTGFVSLPISPRFDAANHAVQEGAFLYVVGSDESVGAGDSRWRIEKRSR